MIDTQDMAQQAADYNLVLLNRLTETCSLTVLGDPALVARRVITLDVDEGYDGNWYLYSVTHNLASSGYTCEMELRQ